MRCNIQISCARSSGERAIIRWWSSAPVSCGLTVIVLAASRLSDYTRLLQLVFLWFEKVWLWKLVKTFITNLHNFFMLIFWF